MSIGRKLVNCIRCNKTKRHFGHQMCSACLRRTKRETKPGFYLGTCYSELSRRIKTYDPKRPGYFGLEKCTKEEFIKRFIGDETFLYLYKNWQNSGFKRRSSPSIDRIDVKKGYTLDNMQFITHRENSKKDNQIKIAIQTENRVMLFSSCKEASKFLNMNESSFCKARKSGRVKGYRVYETT